MSHPCVVRLVSTHYQQHYAKFNKAKSKHSNGRHHHKLHSACELQIITIKVNDLAVIHQEQTKMRNYGHTLVVPNRPAENK